MASFVVMERPGSGARDFEVVRDGFHWLALLFPFFWFLFHRMWIEAVAVLALGIGIGLLTDFAGLDWLWPFGLLVALVCGFEAPALRVAALRRAGWREWGVVEARDRDGAEIGYLDEAGTAAGFVAADGAGLPDTPVPGATAARPATGPALGFLSYPGGR